MATVEVARLVRAPVTDVWQVLTDLRSRSRVMSTVDAVEVLGDPAFGVGTRWRETRTLWDTEPVTEEFTVVAAAPPYQCVLDSQGPGEDYRLTFDLTPRHGHTRVHVQFATALPARLTARMLSVFFGGMVVRVIEGTLRQDLEDLATAVQTAAA